MNDRLVVSSSDDASLNATVADWFDRHVTVIHGYVARRVGPEIARDVVAETFRVALEQFDDFDPRRGSERAWLFGIATNLVRRHWRTESRRLRTLRRSVVALTVPGDPLLAIDESLDAHRRLERLAGAFDRLSPEDRDLLVLTAWEAMSSAEAAAVLGVPPGTVRSRLNRIRTELRRDEAAPRNQGHDRG